MVCHRENTVKRFNANFSIGQNILVAIIGIVLVILIVTGSIFYTSFSSRTDDLIENQSREINRQIVYNFENYINSVIETANYIQYISALYDVEDSYDFLQDKYLVNTEIKKDVAAVFLFNTEGEKILGNDLASPDTSYIIRESWFWDALNEDLIYHFQAKRERSISEDSEEEVIVISRAAEYYDQGEERTGVIRIELNSQAITDLAKKTNLGPSGHILILDDQDDLIYSLGSYTADQLVMSKRTAIENHYGSFSTRIDSKAMYMNITPLSRTRWRIVIVHDVDDTAQAKKRMLIILMLIFLGTIIVSVIVSVIISRRISHPIYHLREKMARVEQGDFHAKVHVTGQKEVVQLSDTFNSMIDKIRSLMDRVVNEQREKRKTELIALQNQINPHFLYNTLDSIIWLAEHDRSEDVITTVSALAHFFRISISGGESFITVNDEISHVSNYLTIQKIRYQKKFEYLFEIDSEIYEDMVMKLILQPLVENAINYGIGDEQETITIRGYRYRDGIAFDVENTGYGITLDQIDTIYQIMHGTKKASSVGLRNVYLRLKLYYGDKADILISSELDASTTFKIIIPSELLQKQEVRS